MNKGNFSNTAAQVSEISEFPFGLTEPIIVKLVEYGGFVSAMLALCLFFKVLTIFVKGVKED
ncbi:MAG: hypothetical protein F6J97_00940 [Leptolyngbya sp. SIO4C1]|nr:hypothetical protein [Leptolyngbya sp. SIO4C1]